LSGRRVSVQVFEKWWLVEWSRRLLVGLVVAGVAQLSLPLTISRVLCVMAFAAGPPLHPLFAIAAGPVQGSPAGAPSTEVRGRVRRMVGRFRVSPGRHPAVDRPVAAGLRVAVAVVVVVAGRRMSIPARC
jgi:hypothetical protein